MNTAHDNEQTDREMNMRGVLNTALLREIRQVEDDFGGVESCAAAFLHDEISCGNPYADNPVDIFDEKLRVLEIWFEQIIEGYEQMRDRIVSEVMG